MVEKYTFKIATERNLKKLLASNDISQYNKDVLTEYSSDLTVLYGQKDATICNKLQIMDLIFSTVHTDLNQLTRKDIKRILAAIENHEMPNGKKWNDQTKFNYKAKVKQFIAYLHQEEIIKEPLYDIIKLKMPSTIIQPQDILTEDEVQMMIDCAANLRDKAMISLAFDIGARIGEILTMQLKHYIDSKHGGRVTITGKTGTRTIQLNYSIFYVRQWINAHPDRSNPEAYLWCNLKSKKNSGSYDVLNYHTTVNMFKAIGKKAGITKKTNPHRLRHAAVTRDTRHFSDGLLKKKFGWTPSSGMISNYSHIMCQDVNTEILRTMGIIETEKRQEINRCKNCGEINPYDFKWCGKCGNGLNDNIKKEMDSIITDILFQLHKNPEIFAETLSRMKA